MMGNSSERRELLFTKLDDVFGPAENLSPYSLKDKWRVVPYEAEERIGNILASIGGTPEDISFDPRLTGWYKIYIGLLRDCVTTLKLTSDTAFFTVASSPVSSGAGRRVEEALWRCADMTDESITVTKKFLDEPYSSCLASIRFVPMSDEDVAEYKKELARRDTKRIYATDDMHNRFYFLNLEKMEDWDPVVLKYIGSDVEWISMEELRSLTSGKCPVDDLDLVDFARAGDKRVQKQLGKFDYGEILRHLVELGHKHNFKMSISLRMGAWGIGYPSDQCYFDSAFEAQHPEYKCVDRNGDVMSAMSYAFPEVQDYLVDTIVNMARSGCDAVTLIAHRGIPYLLFEKPIADRFYEMYGEYPYELPLDEKRLHALHCEIMLEFMRKVRRALDENFGEHKVKIHLRTLYTVHDTDYIGLNCERLAREGLIDAIISYPTQFYEKLDGDIWQEGKDYRIDLEKYTDYVVKTCRKSTIHDGDMEVFFPPYKNYKGELCGPSSEKERIAQWMHFEHEYGVKVYMEILKRHYNNDVFKKRALELYDNGAERIGLWDSYTRAPRLAMWTTAGKLGHKEELRDMDTSAEYRIIQIRRLAGYDISRYEPSWGG